MTMRALPLLLVFLSAPALAAPSIRVQPRASIAGPVVRLGQVAQLKGFTPEAKDRFGRIELGRSPQPGLGQLLPKAFLRSKIRDGGVGPGVKLHLPSRLEVTRKTRTIKASDLERQVRRAIRKAMPHADSDVAKLVIPRLSDVNMPVGTTVQVDFAPGEDFRGAVTANLRFEAHGEVVRTRRVSARLDAFARAWGVRKVARRGRVLSAGDLVPLRLPESKVPNDAIQDPGDVEGARVRRPIKPGEAIRAAYVKVPPLIRRGDRVRMIAVRGSIRITAMGEALGAAARGQNVRVRNLDSKRVVSGRVTAPNTIEMEF
jgi:flagellar basal body P-ring formation protein FlgA